MKDPADVPGPRVAEDPERVLRRLAGVNRNRKAQLARRGDLCAEDLLLDHARREVVVIVEADLADGARALTRHALTHRLDGAIHVAGECPRVMRMDAGREAYAGQAVRTAAARTDSSTSSAPRMHRAVVTPESTARVTTASRSPTNSGPARWQWESIMGAIG